MYQFLPNHLQALLSIILIFILLPLNSTLTSLPSTIQTNPLIQPISAQSQFNTINIPPPSFSSHTTHAIPSSTIPLTTLTTSTYINSSASISDSIKSFDGLDHNYTPEEYLQHIEARVAFSL